MYIVQASPLSKIFLPQWHNACLENPKLIEDPYEDELDEQGKPTGKRIPFTIEIPRPVGAISLRHNVPVVASSLVIHTKERKITEDEVSPLVRWLTDENEAETDIYGVVAVPIENNVADAIMSLIYDKDGEERQLNLIRETKKRMSESILDARERADKRVMRQCDKMYTIVRTTVQELKKSGKGVYAPSYSEALALEILSDAIAQRRKPDERAQELMDKAMQSMHMSGV